MVGQRYAVASSTIPVPDDTANANATVAALHPTEHQQQYTVQGAAIATAATEPSIGHQT